MAATAIFCEKLTKRYPAERRQQAAPTARRQDIAQTARRQDVAQAAQRQETGAPGVLAVDRLDLEVETGEFFGLLGPNGAGKTTTIGMLTTRVVPTSGRAVVAGLDVVAQPAETRCRIAAVTQTNTLDRGLTVYDNLYFHGRYFRLSRAESRRRTEELLRRFELTDRAEAKIPQLSGGLAKRVLVARALLHRPQVLFLDEPTAGLDPQTRVRLWEELAQLNRAGQTIVLTTHYMEEADRLCRRIAIIDHGRLLGINTPQAFKDEVHGARLLRLTLAAPAGPGVAGALAAVTGVLAVETEERVVRVEASASPGLVGAVVAAVAQAGGELRDLSVSEPSLEAVFLKLTGKEYRT